MVEFAEFAHLNSNVSHIEKEEDCTQKQTNFACLFATFIVLVFSSINIFRRFVCETYSH